MSCFNLRRAIIFVAGALVWYATPLVNLEAQASPTDQDVVHQRGLSMDQVKGLHTRFGLSNEVIEGLNQNTLQPMLWQLAHPKIDLHAAANHFRLLKLRDENGKIPANAWIGAAQQRAQIVSHSKAEDVQALFPSAQSSISSGAVSPAVNSAVRPNVAGISSSGWTWLGPGNIGGRVRSILVHPTTNSIMWAGGVDGGVWKTTNGGAAWFPLNDFMANLAISCMVMDPTNPNVIFVGTGEGMYNQDAVQGAGIFKTTDGGNTWTQLSSTTTGVFWYVNRLAICPTNDSIIIAATRSGIMRTADGGNTWTPQIGTEMLDIQFSPSNGQAIASGWNGNAFYSSDAGVTWTAATGLPNQAGFVTGRVEVSFAASNPSIVYASVDTNSGSIFKSTDGGHTYSFVSTGNSYLGGQGWYDNCIWVDPTNPNNLVVGGLDIWRSLNGGATLTDIGGYSGSIHPDNHAIVAIPTYNGSSILTVFIGNDGGIFKATDILTASSSSGWTTLNNNLGITQFYGAAGNVTSGTIVAGAQDNGTERYTPTGGAEGWGYMFGGDGGYCASDPSNPNYFYGEYTYLSIFRSTDGGNSASYIYNGISDAGGAEDYDPGDISDSANFIAPFILDPNNPNTMLAGGMSLWVSTNVKATTPTWTAIKASIGSPVSAIAVAPGNSSIIWVGYDDGAVYYTLNGTAASPTWTQVSGLPGRYCECITIDPNSSSTVYVTLGGFTSGNVWRTTNTGANWSNISGNLPSAPVNSLVIKPTDSGSLYVGTEVGVFATANGGSTWSTSNDGPANVCVDQLFWMNTTLVAVTHGRGCFSIAVSSGDPLVITPGTGFTSVGLAGGPFSPTAATLTLTNQGSSSLQWSLVNTSSWLNVSSSSGILGADGTTSVTGSLNTAANSLAIGSYSANLVFSNQTSHTTQTRTFTLAVTANQLVQNGGFETGDFTDWTLSPNNDNANFVDSGALTQNSPHSGSYFAAFGQYSADGIFTISQTLSTTPGTAYLLSFWWQDSDLGTSETPNQFEVLWNGTTLLNEANTDITSWTDQQYLVTATSTSTTLTFGATDDNWYIALDDVSVVPFTPPKSQVLSVTNNQFQFSWNSIPNVVYQVQYTTNLLSNVWLNLGAPVTATNSTTTVNSTIGPDQKRFYRTVISL